MMIAEIGPETTTYSQRATKYVFAIAPGHMIRQYCDVNRVPVYVVRAYMRYPLKSLCSILES